MAERLVLVATTSGRPEHPALAIRCLRGFIRDLYCYGLIMAIRLVLDHPRAGRCSYGAIQGRFPERVYLGALGGGGWNGAARHRG